MKGIVMLAIIAVFLLFGCASSSVLMTVTRPAEVNLKEYDKIALGDIVDSSGRTTKHSQDTAEFLTTALFESKRFEVLDRQNIGRILSEHQLSYTGIVDEDSAAELGKIIGAGVLVFGRIQVDKYDEKTTKDDPYKDKEGKWHQIHTREGVYNLDLNEIGRHHV